MTANQLATKLLLAAALAGVFVLTLSSASTAQTVERTFRLGAAPHITVDNLNGPIQVVGDGGDQVRFTAVEANPENATDVRLEVTTTTNSLELYVDGPFRDQDRHRGEEHAADQVRFSFELHVPVNSILDLRTVSGGGVSASHIAGDYQLRNVNGEINLDHMSGSGAASTVNGAIKARFSSNPRADSKFNTVNGDVSLTLQPGLNADLAFTTLHGSAYSDFAAVPLAASGTESASGQRIEFRRGRASSVRIGDGGPRLECRSVNGDIFLHRAR